MESKEFKAKITSKNQLTLPAGISAFLHVGPGSEIRFEITDDGVRVKQPGVEERLAYLVGSARQGAGKSWEQIDAGIREIRGPRDE